MASESTDAESLRAALAAATVERDRLRAALGAADQVKSEFMARMTHELRTPLSAIIGLAHLAGPLVGDPNVLDYLSKIVASAKGLLGVVDDITDFSRLEKGLASLSPVPFDLADALARVARRFVPAARDKGLALNVNLDPRAPTRLVGDNARLEGVLSQLVGNAVKFTLKGSVEVAVKLLWRRQGQARLAFAVSDTGIGMDRETIPAMLESFTQGDGSLSRPYGGTGLGLALVRRGAALLGGALEVDSRLGQGTRFSFEATFAENMSQDLPEPAAPAAQPQPAARTSPGAAGQVAPSACPCRPNTPLADTLILLVEDNTINQQVAREILERFGASVDVAGNGREAVAMVKRAVYDAVLMDVQMPVMDGLAATRAIRHLPGGADLPIVALTAHALAEDRQRCLEAGMNDYLTKPIDPGRLLAALGQWIVPAAAPAAPACIWPDQELSGVAAVPAPGLDRGQALGRLGGNERLLESIAAEFVRDYAASADGMARSLAAGDLDGARRLAHTVKGVAGNIAAEALAATARDLEIILGQGNVPPPSALEAYAEALAGTIEAAARLAPPPQAPPACVQTGGCWRVLLVDDAKLNRVVFSQILRSAGHEVATAVNGKDACRVLFGEKNTGRPFDCILMDIEMPEMDGPTATRVIRGLLAASANPPCPPGVAIVALTSHEVEAERGRCLAAGMDECLHKAFARDALLAALARIMGGHGPTARRASVSPPAAFGPGLVPLVRRLAGHLAEGSIRADEDVAALCRFLAEGDVFPEMEELTRAVERYDFTAALDALGRLAPRMGVDPTGIGPRAAGGTPA